MNLALNRPVFVFELQSNQIKTHTPNRDLPAQS